MYDAIIAGARCSGSVIAILVARKGYRVLVVDRASPATPPPPPWIHQPRVVESAGYHKAPCTAQGTSDAFRDAELLAQT
jgi:flavin-dependent dehydrogenase